MIPYLSSSSSSFLHSSPSLFPSGFIARSPMILIGVRAGVTPMQCYLIFLAIHHLDNVCKQGLAAKIELAMCVLSRSQ